MSRLHQTTVPLYVGLLTHTSTTVHYSICLKLQRVIVVHCIQQCCRSVSRSRDACSASAICHSFK